MPVIQASYRLCFQDWAVPLEETQLPWLDPYELADGFVPEGSLHVSLVNFKASGDMCWIEKGLELKARWWKAHHHRIPLLVEILDLIRAKKPHKGAAVLLPKNHKSLVPLKVRGKTLWFENNSRIVVLALQQGQEIDHFKWFLEEINKDIEGHAYEEEPEPDEPEPAKSRKCVKVEIPKDLEDIVEHAVTTLQGVHNCLTANYIPSRMSLKVVRSSDKEGKEIRVKDLKRKQQKALESENLHEVQHQFNVAMQQCMEFLSLS